MEKGEGKQERKNKMRERKEGIIIIIGREGKKINPYIKDIERMK